MCMANTYNLQLYTLVKTCPSLKYAQFTLLQGWQWEGKHDLAQLYFTPSGQDWLEDTESMQLPLEDGMKAHAWKITLAHPADNINLICFL